MPKPTLLLFAIKSPSVLNDNSSVAFNLYLALNASLIVKEPSFLKEIFLAFAIKFPPTLGFAKFKVPSGEVNSALLATLRLILPLIWVLLATMLESCFQYVCPDNGPLMMNVGNQKQHYL